MPKKTFSAIIDQNQGFVMTDKGLLIPGKFLRKMGEKISVAFSPRLIVISSLHPSHRPRKGRPEKAAR
jgi:hypothetical protein